MHKTLALLLIFGFLLLSASGRTQTPAPEELEVVADGMAAMGEDPAGTEEEAIWDAKRNAVEKVAGVFLRARSLSRDFSLVEDEVRGRADGFVRHWEVIPDSKRIETVGNGGYGKVFHVKIRATVALLPVLRRLADMRDVYNDLERPRVRIEMEGGATTASVRNAQSALLAALQVQGFEIASSGPAEILLSGRVEIVPTVRLGDKESPYGIGETLAASRARFTLKVVSAASEEVLLTARAEGSGQSFQADTEADVEAAVDAVATLLKESESLFTQRLLARWVRERQEGHSVIVQVTGLNEAQRDNLRTKLAAMRGFLKFNAESGDRRLTSLRFLTRLDTRSLRRRLNALRLDIQTTLTVKNERGPIIVCAANAPALRATRK